MEAPENLGQINLQPLADFFTCPVCLCPFNNAVMTVCGHRYCESCITESVQRHHKCPCCNAALATSDLIKDHQYDELLKVFKKEQEKAEKRYFDHLLEKATSKAMDTDSVKSVSPVEEVLKKHLKESLIAHEKYYQDLRSDCLRRQASEELRCDNLIAELNTSGVTRQDFEKQSSELRAACIQQKEYLQLELDKCSHLIAEAYAKHLTEHIPDVFILPVKISVKILSKSISVPDFVFKPHDTVDALKDHIENYMELKGDKIVKYGPDCRFVCFGPFSKRSQYEMHQAASDIVEFGATHNDMFILPDGCRPVLQFRLKPGSEVTLYGMVQCESDLPKQCFAASFNPGAGQKVDYFSCKDCAFNWVCRSCMETCHKDHNTVPYIMDHQPTWACCYCPKKKKCTLGPR